MFDKEINAKYLLLLEDPKRIQEITGKKTIKTERTDDLGKMFDLF